MPRTVVQIPDVATPANENAVAPRAVGSSWVSFGLLSVPARVHAAGRPARRPRVQRTDELELRAFVPRTALSLTMIGRSRYLSPDVGGERSFALLAHVLEERELVAVGTVVRRGRRVDVAIVPEGGALVLADLVVVPPVPLAPQLASPFKDVEIELAAKLVGRALADRVELAPTVDDDEDLERDGAPRAEVIDLFEALKRSLTANGPTKAEPR